MNKISFISIDCLSNFQVNNRLQQIIFKKLPFRDLINFKLVSRECLKNVSVVIKESLDPFNQFLEIVYDSLRDVADCEIQEQFKVCKNIHRKSPLSIFVDLSSIEISLRFLLSKLSDDQFCKVWALWAEKHHDRVLINFLAHEYFDRLVPYPSDFDSVWFNLRGCSPAIFGFISVAFEKVFIENEHFCDFMAVHVDPMLQQKKIDQLLNWSHHLFAEEPLARLLCRIAFNILLQDKDIDKALKILVTNHRIIFKEYEDFDALDDLSEALGSLLEAGVPLPKEPLEKLKELFPVFEEILVLYFV